MGGGINVSCSPANISNLLRALTHTSYIFPEATNETITLTAAGANVWSAWTEVVDNNAVTLSSKFAANAGHLSVMTVETCSVNGQVYMWQLAYGAARTLISPGRIYSGAVPKQETRVYGLVIPAGQRVYYRLMCSQAGPQNLTGHFRYHYH